MSGTAAADLERDGGGFLRGLERNARPKRRRHLARHRLFRKCVIGALYPAAVVRPRSASETTKGIGVQSWSKSVRSAQREHALGAME